MRRQAGLGRAGSRRGRGSEKVEQPNDEGGVGGGSVTDGEDKGREAEERQEGGSPGTTPSVPRDLLGALGQVPFPLWPASSSGKFEVGLDDLQSSPI